MVEPDELRRLAARKQGAKAGERRAALRAAADEIERLRRCIAESELTEILCKMQARSLANAAAEIKRLRERVGAADALVDWDKVRAIMGRP